MSDKFILYSGGAPGADSYFGTLAEWHGISEQHYSFEGHVECRSRGRVILCETDLDESTQELEEALGDILPQKGSKRWYYWCRNCFQVKYSEEVFAVREKSIAGSLDFSNTESIEGESIPVIIALLAGKTVCVFSQEDMKVYTYPPRSSGSTIPVKYIRGGQTQHSYDFEILDLKADERGIIHHDLKIGKTRFTGIGTRDLNQDGRDFIKYLYENTFATL